MTTKDRTRYPLVAFFATTLTALLSTATQAAPVYQIDTLPIDITKPGTYKLSKSLSATGNAIQILSDDVEIDLAGYSITGPADDKVETLGIYSFGNNHITVRNGSINGFTYGIYVSALVDSLQSSGDLSSGRHRIEQMRVRGSTFRGIRVEGNNSVVADNQVADIGGTTLIPNAYSIGIEAYGPNIKIRNNIVEEVRGSGTRDIGEGVGISLTRFNEDSIIEGNAIYNREAELEPGLQAWETRSRSTYGIWVGGDGVDGIVVKNNFVMNYRIGITFKRSEAGAFANNHVTHAFIPYYLPANEKFERVQDLGGNTSDQSRSTLLFGRATPGQIELVEPPKSTYLAPLHRLSKPYFLAVANPSKNDDRIEARGLANMVDYWHPDFETGTAVGVRVDLSQGKASGCCGNDELIGIQGAQGTPYDDILIGNDQDNLLAGGEGNDVLKGKDGNDYLFGDAGNDQLFGDAGNDVLDGGAGDDDLWGGPGSDIFVFWAQTEVGNDTIHDFAGINSDKDKLDIAGRFFNFEEVMSVTRQAGRDTVIQLNDNESITLKNYKMKDLAAEDFMF